MSRADLTRTDLGLIATVLTDLDTISMYAAAKTYHVDRTTILRWVRKRAESGGTWPTTADITAQRLYLHSTATRRRRVQQRNVLGAYRRVPAIGACRRVQALRVTGYRLSDIATAAGVSKARIHQLAHYHNPTIHLETHDAVKALYRALVARPAPTRSPAMMTRHQRVCTRNGWYGPLAWESDDDLDNPRAFPREDAVA